MYKWLKEKDKREGKRGEKVSIILIVFLQYLHGCGVVNFIAHHYRLPNIRNDGCIGRCILQKTVYLF